MHERFFGTFFRSRRLMGMTTPATEPLFATTTEPAADGRTSINTYLWFVDRDGYRVVFCRHEPIYRVGLDDVRHLRQVAVALRQSELATQQEIARAFACSVAALRRWERRFQQHGLDGLDNQHSSGRPRRITASQETCLRRWVAADLSITDMARRLGVSTTTVDRALHRLGLHRPKSKPPVLPGIEPGQAPAAADPARDTAATPARPHAGVAADVLPEGTPTDATTAAAAAAGTAERTRPPAAAAVPATPASAPVPAAADTPGSAVPLPAGFTIDHDPRDRSGDRLLARQGLLADAVPLFADADALPRAGVWLALPLLVRHGTLTIFQKIYGSLAPAFYGLRTLVVTLFVCALLRIKRPENLKEYAPGDLGQLVGLDRMPEVKTLRRKLSQLAQHRHGVALMQALAEQRLAEQGAAIAFLYLDGHVREYHGKEPLTKAKKAQRQVATPAATDVWVNDGQGVPLLVVTLPMNEHLTLVLEPIVAEVQTLMGPLRRFTVLFDRGGFSAKLFRRLLALGVDLITYRRGKRRKVPRRCFQEQHVDVDGRRWSYCVYDQARVRVGRLRAARKHPRPDAGPEYLWMRQITVLRDDGRQTVIVTNRTDLTAAAVAYHLFQRWRQENYFKYMEAEYALDALIEYAAEELPAAADRPNPRRAQLNKQLRQARAEVARLQAELGEQVEANAEQQRSTVRGFKIAHAELRRQLQAAEQRVERLRRRRQKEPKRIPASDRKQLPKEKKLVVDALKMVAYQVETELLGLLHGEYARVEDEGRTFLQAVFQSRAEVKVMPGVLQVTIAAQSAPHRTQALAQLCVKLNAQTTCYPGSDLRLQFAVQPHEPLIS
jgi:transposase